MTRSPIELFWTAKKRKFYIVMSGYFFNLSVDLLFVFCFTVQLKSLSQSKDVCSNLVSYDVHLVKLFTREADKSSQLSLEQEMEKTSRIHLGIIQLVILWNKLANIFFCKFRVFSASFTFITWPLQRSTSNTDIARNKLCLKQILLNF